MAKYREIIDAAGMPADIADLAFLNVNRALNLVPGMRPSDCARDEVRDFQRLGADAYRDLFIRARGHEYAAKVVRLAEIADPTGIRHGAAAGATREEENRQRVWVEAARRVLAE